MPRKFLGFSGGNPTPTERAAHRTGRRRVGLPAAAGRPSCRFLRAELGVDDLAIGLAGRHQLAVRPDPDDPAAVEHDDPVGAHDRADALGDDDDRGVRRSRARGRRGAANRS